MKHYDKMENLLGIASKLVFMLVCIALANCTPKAVAPVDKGTPANTTPSIKELTLEYDHGINVKSLTLRGIPAAAEAGRLGDLDSIRWLAVHGSDFSELGGSPLRSALEWAAAQEDVRTGEILLRSGADPNMITPNNSALIEASKNDHPEFVNLLIRSGAKVRGNAGSAALQWAAYFGSSECAKRLLEGGVPVDSSSQGMPECPLFLSSANGNSEVVSILLSAGAQTRLATGEGLIPLHCVGNAASCSLLIQKDPGCINIPDNLGRTSLHRAVLEQRHDVVQILVDNGAQLVIQDKEGNTPLHYAATIGDQFSVKLLVAHRSPVDISNLAKQTPLDCANFSGHKDIAEIIRVNK